MTTNNENLDRLFETVAEQVEAWAEDNPDLCMVVAVAWPEGEPSPYAQLFGGIPKQTAAEILRGLAASFTEHVGREQ